MTAQATLQPPLPARRVLLRERFAAFYPWLVVTLLVGAAAVLRFHALGQKSIWVDEAVSIEMARLDWYNFARILWRHEANMALYTLLLRFWLPFGDSEAWIRTLSVIPALATIPAVYVLGRKLFNPRVGLIAALLITVNAFHVRYSQEARSYSLYPFLCVLSFLYFVKFLEEPSRENRIRHVITSALAVYAHFFAGLAVVAQWLSLKLLDRKHIPASIKNNWRQFAIAIVPLVLFVATTGIGVLRWIPRPGLSSLHTAAVFLTGAGGNKLLYLYAAACILALIPVVRALFRRRQLAQREWRIAVLAIWVLFPILSVFVLSQWKPCFLARYFIFTVPAISLLAAAGIERLRSRWLIGPVLVLFGAWSLPAVYANYEKDIDIAREDFRNASEYVLGHAQGGDVLLFHQPIGRMPYEYYRSITAAAAYPTVIYPEHGEQLAYKDFYSGRAPESFLASVPAQYSRVWVMLTYNQLPDGPDATTRVISDSFARQYPSVEVKQFTGVEVRLYQRAAGK